MARDVAMGNEASRHFMSPARKQRWQMIVLNSLCHAVHTSSCTMLPSLRMDLPHPVRLITIIPHRFTEKLVSLTILDSPKLINNIYYPFIIYMPLTIYLPITYLSSVSPLCIFTTSLCNQMYYCLYLNRPCAPPPQGSCTGSLVPSWWHYLRMF